MYWQVVTDFFIVNLNTFIYLMKTYIIPTSVRGNCFQIKL